jgi:ABC-type lipoprotein export system ATPase subunit
MTNKLTCVLIDDIGEGLDYERSSNLIKLLLKKMKKESIQLIMSTNDRFVMNNIPYDSK